MNLLIILLTALLFNSGCKDNCEKCHDTIMFKNETYNSIYVDYMFHYPDTLLYFQNPLLQPYYRKVLSNTNNSIVLRNLMGSYLDYWEDTFDGQTIPSDTLMVFVFDEDVLKNNTWQEVVDNYMVLQRYDLSLQDLQQLNWQISYPPSEAMKDMKMYPSYK